MSLAVFISAIAGLLGGASGGYFWHKAYMQKQLRQVLAVMETSQDREDISLPIASQLRRKIIIGQQQQQQLEQQLFSWQSLLQEAPIGYVQIDAENQMLWCNQVAQDLLHIQNWQSGQGRLLLELVRSYELDRSIQTVRSSQVAQQLIWQFYYGYQETADSQSIWLKANSIPLADGAIGVFIESQQAQIEAATARERWLTDLAHEIRTPLTAIRLVAETLQPKVTPDLTRWVNRMLAETNRLIDLVQHFLELSQLETSPAQYLRLARVDLVVLIEDAWYTLEPIASQRQIELIYTGAQQLVLEIDQSRFMQVFINLFDNSLKYCPDRGHIWIDIQQVDRDRRTSQVEINLYDDGEGFDRSDLPHVFDRLYRGDLSRNRQSADLTPSLSGNENTILTTGSGLGLAIVRQIILAHGGTVTANNHPKTGGAWIQVVLPNS
jgi:two-component system, OmpR family, phosphate regulon sensor histidine kinase PhoR